MIYNILEAPYYKIDSIGEVMTLDSGDTTIMGHFHNIYSDDGLLKAAGDTSMTDPQYHSNYAIIDDKRFQCNFDGAQELVGYNVKYYYRSDDKEDDTIVAMFPYRNNVLEIDAGDLLIEDSDYSEERIVYENKNGKKSSARVGKYANMIYNEEAYPDFTLQTLQPLEGKMTLVDHNRDDVYDLIIMDVYKNVLVKSCNLAERVVIGSDNSMVDLDNSAGRSVTIWGSDGAYYEFADISAGNIATIYQSQSGRKTTVYISTNIVFDEITEVSSDGYVKAGDTTYEIDKNFLNSAEYKENPIHTRTNTGLYLDKFGKIAAIGEAAARYRNYGYVCDGEAPEGVGNKYQLKVFTEDGEFVIFTLKDRVMCDGVSQAASDVWTRLQETKLQTLIRYESTDDDVITVIELPVDNTASGKFDTSRFTLDAQTDGIDYNTSRYRVGILGSKYLIRNEQTVVFNIPMSMDEKKFRIGDHFVENLNYKCDIYDLNEVYCAGAVVHKTGGVATDLPSEDQNTPEEIMLVDKVVTAVDEREEGEVMQIIYGWRAGVYHEYKVSNSDTDSVVTDIKKGDVLKIYNTDEDGIVTQMYRIISLSENNPYQEAVYNTSDSGPGAIAYMQYGKVGAIKDGCFTMSVDGGTTIRPGAVIGPNIYIYDKGKDTIKKGEAGSIYAETMEGAFDGDTVFVNKRWDQVVDIVVVRD